MLSAITPLVQGCELSLDALFRVTIASIDSAGCGLRKIIINGGKKLQGEVTVSGAKNSVVALIPAIILLLAYQAKCSGI